MTWRNYAILQQKACLAMALLLAVSLSAAGTSQAGSAVFSISILVEDAATGRPVGNAEVTTSHPSGVQGLRHSGPTDSSGNVFFSVDFGYFSPRGSGNFPEVGVEGKEVDISVSRAGYHSYAGRGMFHVRSQGPVIVRLQPEKPPHGDSRGHHLPPAGSEVFGGHAETPSPARKFQETPITGKLVIISEPMGAGVAIDGQAAEGRTPLAVEIQAGEHEIVLAHGGVRVARRAVVPMEDKVVLEVDLRSDIARHEAILLEKAEEERAARARADQERIAAQNRANEEKLAAYGAIQLSIRFSGKLPRLEKPHFYDFFHRLSLYRREYTDRGKNDYIHAFSRYKNEGYKVGDVGTGGRIFDIAHHSSSVAGMADIVRNYHSPDGESYEIVLYSRPAEYSLLRTSANAERKVRGGGRSDLVKKFPGADDETYEVRLVAGRKLIYSFTVDVSDNSATVDQGFVDLDQKDIENILAL